MNKVFVHNDNEPMSTRSKAIDAKLLSPIFWSTKMNQQASPMLGED